MPNTVISAGKCCLKTQNCVELAEFLKGFSYCSTADMLRGKVTKISLGIALTIVGIMWTVFFFDYAFDLKLYEYGLKPRNLKGLMGIITSPFIHSTKDFNHIINNSMPMLVLTWMLFYHYRTVASRAFLFIYLFTGIMTWIVARDSYHVGMSGVIYGLTSFLVLSGFFRKNMRIAAVSLVVIFLYGSFVWGIFPGELGISWEGHAMGFFGGITAAVLLRKKGPQPQKLFYEIEEELGIEPEFEYWKYPDKQPPQNEPRIIINYTIVPENIKVETEKDTDSEDQN